MKKNLFKPKAPIAPVVPRKFYEVEDKLHFAWEEQIGLNKLLKMFPKGTKQKDIKFNIIRIGKGDNAKFYLEASYYIKHLNKTYQKELQTYKINLIDFKKKTEAYKIKLADYQKLSYIEYLKGLKKEISFLEKKIK